MTETNRHLLSCGHTIARNDHRWVTAKGHDACSSNDDPQKPRCLERLKRQGF